ncbi:MAG TPA: hypothetical protein VFO54_00215, partial [Chryseosolibacter sp.]|nr:hypothetical protein [Chryseosolibacter sp.]
GFFAAKGKHAHCNDAVLVVTEAKDVILEINYLNPTTIGNGAFHFMEGARKDPGMETLNGNFFALFKNNFSANGHGFCLRLQKY